MKFLLVTANFAPRSGSHPTRTVHLAKYLHDLGHEVKVVTYEERQHTLYSVRDDSLLEKVPEAVEVVRIPPGWMHRLLDRTTGSRRAVGEVKKGAGRSPLSSLLVPDPHFSAQGAFVKTADHICQTWSPDVLITFAYPYTFTLIGGRLKQRHPGLVWIADYGDPWAGAPVTELYRPRWRRRLDHRLERNALQRADAVTVTTEPTARLYREHFPAFADRIKVITMGFDPDDSQQIPPQERDAHDAGQRILLHAGRLYNEARDTGPFLRAVESGLREEPERFSRLKVVLLGDLEKAIEQAIVGSPAADRFSIHGWVTVQESIARMKGADGLILFGNKGAIQIPGKIFQYFAARRPIFMIYETEQDPTLDVVRRYGNATLVSNTEADIRRELGEFLDRDSARSGYRRRLRRVLVAVSGRTHRTDRAGGRAVTDSLDIRPPRSAQDCWGAALAADDRATAAGLLQVRGWELLSIYLNGGLGRGAWAYPFSVAVAPRLLQDLQGLAAMWNAYAAIFDVEALPTGGSDAAGILAVHYRRFETERSFLPQAANAEVDLFHAGLDPDRQRLQRHLPRLGSERAGLHSFWLHGSSGDGHWKSGWSDVDTLAIVSADSLSDPQALRQLRRVLIRRRSDLLREQSFQFHGHFVLAGPDLDNCPESMFPAELFDAATPLWRSPQAVTLRQRQDRQLALRMLWIHGIADLVQGAGRPLPRNAAKIFLLHRIYLLPCLYSQALGRPIAKETAWAALDRVVPAWSVDFFEQAGAVWRDWRPLPGVVRGAEGDAEPAGLQSVPVPTGAAAGLRPAAVLRRLAGGQLAGSGGRRGPHRGPSLERYLRPGERRCGRMTSSRSTCRTMPHCVTGGSGTSRESTACGRTVLSAA